MSRARSSIGRAVVDPQCAHPPVTPDVRTLIVMSALIVELCRVAGAALVRVAGGWQRGLLGGFRVR